MGRKINNNYVADFETSTIATQYFKTTGDTRVLLWGMKNMDDDSDDLEGTTLKEFIDEVKQFQESSNIYFHNLSFDGNFIFKYFIKNKFKFVFKLLTTKKDTGVEIFKSGNQIYQIKYAFYNKQGKYIIIYFKCSLKILTTSVEMLGRTYNIKKHEDNDAPDFYDQEPQRFPQDYSPRFREYMWNDIKIVILALKDFKKSFDETTLSISKKINWDHKMTIGSLSFFIQKEYIKEFDYINDMDISKNLKITKESYELAANFYYGGWTQFNPRVLNKLVTCSDGLSYDINSAHPASMTKLLPYGDVYNLKNKPLPKNGDYLIYYKIKVKYAYSKFGNVINLKNWRRKFSRRDGPDGRYCETLENFTCFYLKEEWDCLNKFYEFEGVKIIETYWIRAAKYLEPFINEMYAMRQLHKRDQRVGLSNSFKILLNAGYGKWGTRMNYINEFMTTDKDMIDYLNKNMDNIIKIKNKQFKVLRENGDSSNDLRIFNLEEQNITNFSNKWVAATITAYTRINLWDAILKIGEDNFLYGDTDSIYMKKADGHPELNDDKLGAWKIEQNFKAMIVKGSKRYLIKNEKNVEKITYAGINKGWLRRNMTESIFRSDDTLSSANLKRCSLKSGIVLIWKDYKPNPSSL